ncbi:MAG: hypothetical protein AB2700_18285, partial [Candidatus Thiodiazotropha taylori]
DQLISTLNPSIESVSVKLVGVIGLRESTAKVRQSPQNAANNFHIKAIICVIRGDLRLLAVFQAQQGALD